MDTREVLQSEIRMQIFVKLGLRTHESSDGPANRRVVLQTENWSFCSIGLLIMALAAGGVRSFDRSVLQPSLVVCTVWDQLFGVVSCSVVVEDFRTSLFSDCSLMKTVTSTKKSWCAALPTRKRKIKSIASSNWIDGRPLRLLHQVQKPSCMPLTKVQTLINWTSPKSKSRWEKNAGKSSWTERTNRTTVLNQLNHWIHLTKVRSRKQNFVREEGRPHELSCGYSRTCAIFSHLVPGPLRKLQFSFCKTSVLDGCCSFLPSQLKDFCF